MKNINSVINKRESLDLKRSYMDAYSKKEFKELIEILPIEENILIKYTSKLEEASTEYNNCKNCKGLYMCKNKIKGYRNCYITTLYVCRKRYIYIGKWKS